jgi:hypothetical protein
MGPVFGPEEVPGNDTEDEHSQGVARTPEATASIAGMGGGVVVMHDEFSVAGKQ